MSEVQRKLGPYTLIRKIGRGAFGVVWLAEKKTSIATTTFALKLPRDEDIDLEVFKQEAAIWVQASGHPNVVALIEADTYDNQLVLVSEYVPDGSLATWLKENAGKAPSTDAACEMTEGILAGLAHLHERQIIHRDLKPDNILLHSLTPRLADFGIARLLRSGSYSTNISGTLAYMAPEAFDGKRNEQTDIWSVGVLLYQLFGGRLPYAQTDTVSFIGAIMRSDPPPLDNSVPEPFRQVVMRALKRDPAERYQTAVEMRRDLRDAEREWWLVEGDRNRLAQSALTVAAVDDPEATQIKKPVPDSTLVAQIPQPVFGIRDNTAAKQPTPAETLAFQPQIAPSPQPFQGSVRPLRKSRGKVWLSVMGAVLLTIIFLGARILPHFLKSSSASTADTGSTSSANVPAAVDVRRWLLMLGHADGVDKVIDETSALLQTSPSNAFALRARASAYYLSSQLEKGKHDAEDVARLLSTASSADEYEARCYAKLRLEKLDEALADCNRAIDLDPSNAPAWLTRGALYSTKKDYDHSITDFDKAIELNPDYPLAYTNRGFAWEEKKNYRNGLKDFSRAVELDPNFAIAYNGLGNHYYNLKDFSRAVENYSSAIKLAPKEVSYLLNRANVYYVLQDYDRAMKDCAAAIQLDATDAKAFLIRGSISLAKQNWTAAIDDYNTVIDLNPNDAQAYNNRGSAYYGKQDYEHAIVDYNRSSDLDPKDPTVYHNRGLALLRQQRYDLAISDFSYAITLNPKFGSAYYYRAEAYEAKGQAEAAAADRQKAQELDQKR